MGTATTTGTNNVGKTNQLVLGCHGLARHQADIRVKTH
jgi:molybdenum cofactor biosynthesis enzyme